MKIYSFFLFIVVLGVSSACKTNYAVFQASKLEDFSTAKTSKIKSEKTIAIEPLSAEEIEIKSPAFPQIKALSIKNNEISINNIKPKKPIFKHHKIKIFKTYRKIAHSFESKNRRRGGPFDWVNERLKIGAVFLGLAIIFALLSLKLLTVIFALAAILFIAWGLKRVF